MNLNRLGREVYAVQVTLDPTATGTWEATFDGGTTWLPGTDLGNGSWGWLIAGPDNTGGNPAPDFAFPADGPASVSPDLRLVTGNEEVVVHGPSIDLA